MAIQWFPGHMYTTQKAITERVKDIDVVIELLDARLPGSSANPMLAELTAGRPTLKVLNKQDLADPARTALWLAHYNALPDTRAIRAGCEPDHARAADREGLPRRSRPTAAAWPSRCAC
jgi:ribosome biogenesis GTPase A